MQLTKCLLISTLLVLSSGCSIFSKPKVVVQKEPVYLPIVCPDQAKPAAIPMARVRPQIIEDKIGIYWVGLTAKDYEELSVNLQETIRYIKDLKGVTRYYRECIVSFNEHIEQQRDPD